MTGRRVLHSTLQYLSNFRRDGRALPTFLLVPLALMLLIGWVLRDSSGSTTVAVVAQGDHFAVRDVVSYVRESLEAEGIKVRMVGDPAAAQEALDDGTVDATLTIDREFAGSVLNGAPHTVPVGLRGDDLAASRRLRDAIERALVVAPLQALRKATEGAPADPGDPVDVEVSYVYTEEDYEAFDHLLPALLAFAIFISVFSGALVALSRDRAAHTVERTLASPLRRWEHLSGRVIGYLAVALVQAVILTAAAVWVLDARHTGSIFAAILVAAIMSLAASTMGLWVSRFARSEPEAMQLLPMILVPQAVLCGVIFPHSSLPEALQWASRALPLTYGVDALRDLMLRDRAIYDGAVIGNLAVLFGFAAVFLLLAIRELKPLSE